MKQIILAFLLLASVFSAARAQTPITIDKSTTRHGPEKGSLIIIGGNVGSQRDVWEKFTELAGGKEKARIVVVTNGTPGSPEAIQRFVDTVKKQTGISHVVALNAKSLSEANSEAFIAPLKEATGVYFEGGRQWRIADAYLNTLTHQAFQDVLKRGGVIAGSSAGASIQGSFLWRGDTKDNSVLIGDHTQGLGFLKNSVVDQHLLKRNREFDLVNLIKEAPELIGIGLDEATAIVVQGDTLQVIGKSYVAIYDYNTIEASEQEQPDGKRSYTTSSGPFFFLSKGQQYDLKNRKVIADHRDHATAGSD